MSDIHWTIDNFGKHMEETQTYLTRPRQARNYLPQEHELLTTYVPRLSDAITETENISIASHINGPKGPWFTHKSPQGCFMCNSTTLAQHSNDVTKSIIELIPAAKKLIFKKTGNSLVLSKD